MAGLDLLRELLRCVPHEGYRDGEVPRYGDCRHGCESIVRLDRTDLLSEHDAVCPKRRGA